MQRRAFPDEVNHPEKLVKKTSRIYKLDPILIDGLLCVGGRLHNAPVLAQSRNQIIRPRGDHVTSLIIDHYHRVCGHSDKRGFVRRVKVQTKSAVYERPVDKLCLLVEQEDTNRMRDTKI